MHVRHRHLVLAPQLVHLPGGVLEPVPLSRPHQRPRAGAGTAGLRGGLGTFPQEMFHPVSLLSRHLQYQRQLYVKDLTR